MTAGAGVLVGAGAFALTGNIPLAVLVLGLALILGGDKPPEWLVFVNQDADGAFYRIGFVINVDDNMRLRNDARRFGIPFPFNHARDFMGSYLDANSAAWSARYLHGASRVYVWDRGTWHEVFPQLTLA
mgnify:CR=1 FL=1